VTTTVRFSVADQDYHFVNPSPTGERSDPSQFANFLGNTTTITGGNGYSVTGRGILDFSDDYPSTFDSSVSRRLLHADTSVHVTQGFDLAGGVRIENEHGTSGATSATDRTNSGAFVEARGQALGHLYVNGGLGFDHNKIFGNAWSPRVSVAAYLRQPSARGARRHEAHLQCRQGIKEPSLAGTVVAVRAGAARPAERSGLEPIGPERSRGVDVGIGRGSPRPGTDPPDLFRQRVRDLIEFVSRNVLPQLGVPGPAAAAGFGYVNSQSNDAHGIELSGKRSGAESPRSCVPRRRRDESFSSGTLSPAGIRLPGIKIGQFGARRQSLFRRPANSEPRPLLRRSQGTACSPDTFPARRTTAPRSATSSSAPRCCYPTRIWIRRFRSST
jgi:hypothetical protein